MLNVGFISLGCSKNLVDTEMMIGAFKNHQYNIVNNPKQADIIVINTCGFIESAKQEAINTILEMAEYKKKKCKYLIATGCLVQRYKKELEKELPEVDLYITCSEYEEFWKIVSEKLNEKLDKEEKINLDFMDRVITTGNKTAYLKIAEGCSNRCTYCSIPNIKGPFISRKIEDIIEEANILASQGIQEIIVIAQDTTKYGIDIYGEPTLAKLLSEICKIEGIKWVRFLYAYPETITDELIEVVKNNDKICKYFDIPIQHINDRILKRMNRRSDKKSIEELIDKLKRRIPNVILRTTVIVGFPGETDEEFEELYTFIKDAQFNKLGAFTYSKEDETPASKLPEQIHYKTKESRYNKIMKLQIQVSRAKLEENIGKKFETLIEAKSLDNRYYIGRTYMDVPDMDGVVFIEIEDKNESLIGKFVKCKITQVKDYDLIGKLVNE